MTKNPEPGAERWVRTQSVDESWVYSIFVLVNQRKWKWEWEWVEVATVWYANVDPDLPWRSRPAYTANEPRRSKCKIIDYASLHAAKYLTEVRSGKNGWLWREIQHQKQLSLPGV